MGITYIEGVARGPHGKEEAVRFLIDSGATYSLLPNPIWQAIELEPKREVTFSLAEAPLCRELSRSAIWLCLRGRATRR